MKITSVKILPPPQAAPACDCRDAEWSNPHEITDYLAAEEDRRRWGNSQGTLCCRCLGGGTGTKINTAAYLLARYKKRRTQKGTQ